MHTDPLSPKPVFFDRPMLEAKEFWVASLARDVDVARLPPDRPRQRTAPARGSHVTFDLGGPAGERATKLTGDKPLLVHALLLSALKVALLRLTGTRAVVVGTPATAEAEANALAILTVLDPFQSFKSLLQQVRQAVLHATTHQIYPVSALLRDLGLHHVDDRCALFDVALSIDGHHGELPAMRHDIQVRAGCAAGRVSGRIEFSSELFDAASIERLARGLEFVLEAALRDPSTPLCDLDVCSPGERQHVDKWSHADVAPEAFVPLHRMFEAHVERQPDATAVDCAGRTLTYRQLDTRANHVARQLQSLGVGPEIVVGLCAGPSLARVIGFLGILKAGGAIVPLEPDYPAERQAVMLNDAHAHVMVVEASAADGLAPASRPILVIDGEDAIPGAEAPAVSSDITPDTLAYIVYTSGSTGRPKGVGCVHRGLSNLASAQIAAFGVERSSRVLQFSSFSFDASISEIAMALGAGATLVLADRETLFPGEPLYAFLAAHRITHATLVPSVLGVLPLKPLPDLATLIVAGEACPAALVEQWADGRRFVNAYGPTEITVCASMHACHLGDGEPAIGRPMAGIDIYILDEQGLPVPFGLPGELCLGGLGLARGYNGNPAITAEKFIPNPFSATPGSRLYRTGDRGRFRPDGSIDFLGRRDMQVKLRGFRIELGEIESVLAAHSLVGEAAVLCREDVPGDRRLVAYVSPCGVEEPTDSDLRDYLRGPLPDYMVPDAFVVLPALPRTSKLSVARDQLPAPKTATRAGGTGVLRARDTVELGLTQIWERVLSRNPIGVRENFFELGGHSFLAVKLLSDIRTTFQCDLPLPTLLHRPTIEQLATAVREHRDEATPWSAIVPISTAGHRPALFCVHPAGGTVLCYADLAAALGPDQPFYGLQEFGLAEGQVPFTRIEDMAALYVRAMREVQPRGPYLLAGWSFGGLAAYEMAQQLRQDGEEVALLAMFDTYAPSALSDDLRTLDEVQRLISLFGEDVELSEDHLRSLEPEARVEYVVAQSKKADLLPPSFTIAEAGRLLSMFSANTEAVHAYEPKKYSGEVTLFFATEKTQAIADVTSEEATHGWRAVAGSVQVHDAEGNHHTIMRKPNVQKIGARLRELIDALHDRLTHAGSR